MAADSAFQAHCERRGEAAVVSVVGQIDLSTSDDLQAMLRAPDAQATTSAAPAGVAASAMPRKLYAAPADVRGRGLSIVGELSSRWAARADGTGKTVWSTLPLPLDAGRADG